MGQILSNQFQRQVSDVQSPNRRGYVICGEARAGSSFLTRLLISTGVLGRPHESFNNPTAARRAERRPAETFKSLIQAASTENGVYGLKLFSAHVDLIEKSRWAERLPDLRFVLVERRDLLAQALSLARALQTRQYLSTDQLRNQPHYDSALIARCLRVLAANYARWHAYFARNALSPLRLVYEDWIADPETAVVAVADLVGLEERPSADLARIELRVQRDDTSRDWRERFLAEARDLNRLDAGFGRVEVRARRLRAAFRSFAGMSIRD